MAEESGFAFDTFDATAHTIASGALRSRLDAVTRDESGRFRVAAGSSALHAPAPRLGVPLAVLEAEAEAQRRAREERKKLSGTKPRAAEPLAEAPREAPTLSTWLHAGIVVKVVQQGSLHREKAVVRRVLLEPSRAELALLADSSLHTLPEVALETVLPRVGGAVLVLAGPHAGARGRLLGIDEQAFSARVQLPDAQTLSLPYESVSKTEAQ